MRRLSIAFAVLVAAAVPASAQEPLPDHLTFGYEDEGKVDASQAACEAYIKDAVEWPEAETKQAIEDVCGARQWHVEAYAAIRKSYKALAKQIGEDNRLDQAKAVKGIEAMVKACIDHKTGLTTGGHNIAIDIIPNEIAARCLEIGRGMLDEEIAWLTRDLDKVPDRASP